MIEASRDFTSELEQLAELRRFVREFTERTWPDESACTLDAIELAVQEAAANIVLHAYKCAPGKPIHATARGEPAQLELTLTHEGLDFDPTVLPPPDFAGGRTCGFGVYLIRQIMDDVRYLHGEARRGIVMVKRRSTDSTEEKNDESTR